jgi:hypothetical protein
MTRKEPRGIWTEAGPEAYRKAMACARGKYQRDIVSGLESLSGSTLKHGPIFAGNYAESAAHLLARLRQAGLIVEEKEVPEGRVLVLSLPVSEDVTVHSIFMNERRIMQDEINRLDLENRSLRAAMRPLHSPPQNGSAPAGI